MVNGYLDKDKLSLDIVTLAGRKRKEIYRVQLIYYSVMLTNFKYKPFFEICKVL